MMSLSSCQLAYCYGQEGAVGLAKLLVHNSVDDWIDAGPCPESQRRRHVPATMQSTPIVEEINERERKIGQYERQEHDEYHPQGTEATSPGNRTAAPRC